MLTGPPPPFKPPNWKQSRVRRQHLIALGIPVNLDEMLPRANGKPLPPLHITTRPASVPPETKNSNPHGGTPRSGTPRGRQKSNPSPFGQKPELDQKKISELLELKPGTLVPVAYRCILLAHVYLTTAALSLLPLPTLDRYLAEIRAQTTQTSSLLKHLLQTRESLQQDSETYNRLIGELVVEAQKMKSGRRPR